MEIIRKIKDFSSLSSSVLTIGSYDGIHRGHHEILSAVVNHANARGVKSVLVTFEPHPRHILDPDSDKLSLIMGIDQKLEIIESLGINLVYVIDFTDTFSKTTARDFLEISVLPNFNPEYMIVGYDHHFGNNREGSPEFLESFCNQNDIGLEIIKIISKIISVLKINKIRFINFIRFNEVDSIFFKNKEAPKYIDLFFLLLYK